MARSSRRRRGTRSGGAVPRGVWIGLGVVLVLVAAVVGAKLYADSVAQAEVDQRTEEIEELLADAGPRDFLAFNAGRETAGSIAKEVADQPDFLSVDARAERAVIRFQEKGWWQGFTERCIVAVVSEAGTEVTGLKTACVRVDPADW